MNASATGTIAAISAMMGKKMDAMQKKMTSSLGDKISQCIKRELDRRKWKRSRTRSSDVEEEDDKDDEDDEETRTTTPTPLPLPTMMMMGQPLSLLLLKTTRILLHGRSHQRGPCLLS